MQTEILMSGRTRNRVPGKLRPGSQKLPERPRREQSVLDAGEIFARAGIVMRQRQRRTKFLCRGAAIALLFEQLSEQIVGLESRTFFHGRFEITAQQADGAGKVAISTQKNSSGMH